MFWTVNGRIDDRVIGEVFEGLVFEVVCFFGEKTGKDWKKLENNGKNEKWFKKV